MEEVLEKMKGRREGDKSYRTPSLMQINTKHLGKIFSRRHFDIFFFFCYFSQDTGFDILCRLSAMETICMKCQIQISGKLRNILSICHLLNILREWLRLKKQCCYFIDR